MKKKLFCGIFIFTTSVMIFFFVVHSKSIESGLSLRHWIYELFYITCFGASVILPGMLMFGIVKKNSSDKAFRVIANILCTLCCICIFFISGFYNMGRLWCVPSEKKMPDGTLLLCDLSSLDFIYMHAEPVNILYYTEFIFDDKRYAQSLSSIYDIKFRPQKDEYGSTIFVSKEYPGIENRIIFEGTEKSNYLSNTWSYMLASNALEKHNDIFKKYNILLEKKSLQDIVMRKVPDSILTVVIDNKNKEKVAKAIAEFIQTTLAEDLREDGKSFWENANGYICLILGDNKHKIIEFGLKKQENNGFDESVKEEEILEYLE